MRWVFRILGAIVVLVVLAFGALFVLPTERIASVAADRVSAMTGREVALNGDIRPTLWPHLGVRAESFSVGNPDWVTDGPLIAAEALSVRVPWSAVFSGEIQVDQVTLVDPQITLVRAEDGRVSWSFDDGTADEVVAEEAASPEAGRSFGLDRAMIENGRLLYRDETTGQSFDITGLMADVALPATGAAMVTASAEINGSALSVEAGIDDLAGFLSGSLGAITAGLEWEGGTVSYDGRASLAPSAEGQLSLEATDFGPLARLAGAAAPALPQGFGRDRVALTGQVTLANEGTAHLRDATATLDDTTLSLALDLIPGGDRPTIRGTVRSDAISLASLTQGGGADAGGGAGGWPRDPTDVSGLFTADLDVALALGSVDLGVAQIAPVEARITNDAGRAVVDIDRIGAYGGTLTGQFVANGRGGLSVRTDLALSNVQLQPLMSAFAGYDRLQGTGNARLNVLGIGNNVASLMSSLEGTGSVNFGAGAILGLDIAGMIRNLDASFQGEGARTVYDSITASFAIAGGVMNNDDLVLDAPWGGVTGSGTVNLGAQTVNYRMIPGVLRGADGAADIQVPILVTGSWASPSIRPDLEFLARQELEAQAERLEEEVRERVGSEVRDRVGDVLGDSVGEGLEDQLLDGAGNALRGLFGD
ncbi:MAG: AsmA family protein [Pseudomonadota bacterium]